MRGFTLIELLIALAIISILSTFVYAGLVNFNAYQSLDKDVKGIVTVIEEARATTLSSEYDSQYGVHLESDRVVLFQGATYSASDPNNRETQLSGHTTIAFNLAGGTDDIVFERLTGKTTATGSIIVAAKKDSAITKTIIVYATGIVESR